MRCTNRKTGPRFARGREASGLGEGKQGGHFLRLPILITSSAKKMQIKCPMKLHIIKMTQDMRNEKVMSENLLQSLGLTRL